MIITWFLDSAYRLHVWEGFYDLDKKGMLYKLQEKQLRIFNDDDEINAFFEKIYDFDATVKAPYFLCDEWGTTKL